MERDIYYGKMDSEPIEGLTEQNRITDEHAKKGAEILAKYKNAKANLEKRIVENEEWYKRRHWDYMHSESEAKGVEPASAWLFSTIMNKHADAMDNFPEPYVLPRERSDETSAKTLTAILPVVLENCGYYDVYSLQWWEKLKHGTAVYGTFWDSQRDGGLGDVAACGIDLLNIFWELGISDIQKSGNLFITALIDNDVLKEEYPEVRDKIGGDVIDIKKYVHDDTIDTSNKSVVVDWYYRKRINGRRVVHFIKFVGNTLLYASENDENYREEGWIPDGDYPVVFDVLFPLKDTPCGFGMVDICRNPQEYVDRLSGNILEASMMGAKKRYFASSNTNVNLEEFKDWNEPIVHVEGEISDTRLKEIVCQPPASIYLDVWQMKIEEMKETASNRDVNSGGAAGGGITAASAIAALQEAGNKNSRDMINASYRAQEKVYKQCIERIRQNYTESRTVRITGNTPEGYEFVDFDASAIRDIQTGVDSYGEPTYRHPVFDLKVKAQKKNPFSRMEQNERAKELYSMGFFSPDRAEESLAALDMMDFEGIDKVREYVQKGQTLLNICKQQQAQIAQLQMLFGMAQNPSQLAQGGTHSPQMKNSGNAVTDGIMQAQTPRGSYAASLAKRSTPSV